MAQARKAHRGSYNGKLSIPLPFEDALKAATEVKPPERKPKKRPAKKRAAKR